MVFRERALQVACGAGFSCTESCGVRHGDVRCRKPWLMISSQTAFRYPGPDMLLAPVGLRSSVSGVRAAPGAPASNQREGVGIALPPLGVVCRVPGAAQTSETVDLRLPGSKTSSQSRGSRSRRPRCGAYCLFLGAFSPTRCSAGIRGRASARNIEKRRRLIASI